MTAVNSTKEEKMKTALANQSFAGAPLNYPRKLRIVQSDAEEKFRAKVEEIMMQRIRCRAENGAAPYPFVMLRIGI